MKKLMYLLLLVSFALPAGAAVAKKKKPVLQRVGQKVSPKISTGKKISFANEKKLSTDVVFDGSMVNGRYHTAGEAVATVETEKKMNELVGFRRDFRDRLVEEKSRLKSQGI